MNRRLSSLQDRWDRRLNLALAILWSLVLWRTGLASFGYALLALVSDFQALLGPPLPQSLNTSHPYGAVVELSVLDLRQAWWIAPHLKHAHHLFLLGVSGSLIIWAFTSLVMLRHRARLDPTINAQVNLSIQIVERSATRLFEFLAEGGLQILRSARELRSRPELPILTEKPDVGPHAATVEPQSLSRPAMEAHSAQTRPGETEREKTLTDVSAGGASVDGTEGSSRDGSRPASPSPYTSSFFTRF